MLITAAIYFTFFYFYFRQKNRIGAVYCLAKN
ncbi:hypothetical protein CLV31_11652 [Algoriphagus aquaeductus]|uniref:Uncharacterized protein n=1 Tax=Algoriphagus aquaeductus TaxID=475299 RepID=A0A326RPL3_9BACT|nr:hypothetical protein CLV31_11652 [Algoriphagus aquaeductus]